MPLAVLAILGLAAGSVHAANLTSSPTAPTIDGLDIANLGPANASDKWWPGTSTAYGSPGMTVGQTFTNGNNGVWLDAFTFQMVGATLPTKTYIVRVGTASGTTFLPFASEMTTQTVATAANDYWTWTLGSPIYLPPNSVYGVDVGFTASTTDYTTGMPYVYYTNNNSAYAGGTRFRSGTLGNGIGDNTLSQTTGDRVFHVNLAAPSSVYWDLNGPSAGSCASGNTAPGTWNATNPYWNGVADGTGTTALWTPGYSAATFGASGDATGTYPVTVEGTQDIGGLSFKSGTVTLTPGANGALRLTGCTAVEVGAGLTATVATPITQDVAGRPLAKVGAGTLVLSGANSYSGSTIVEGGTLRLGASGALPASDVLLMGNTPGMTATLDLNGYNATIGGLSLSGWSPTSGAAVTTGAGTLSLGGDVSYNAGANPLGATISGALDLGSASRTFTVNHSTNAVNDLTVSANISGSGVGLTNAGTGKLVLSGTNTYNGGTTVSSGTLQFNSAQAIADSGRNVTVTAGATVVAGYAMDNAFLNRLVDQLPDAFTVALGVDSTNDLDFNSAAGANLSGATLGASGACTYTGTLTPNGMGYRLGGGGGTLTLPKINALTGSGFSLTVPATNSTVVLSAANDYDGGTTLYAGTLALGSDNSLGSGPLTFNGGGISSDSTTAHTLPNAITFTAGGTLGDTVRNGKLTFTNTTTLAATSTLTVNSAAEFAGAINVSSYGVGLTKAGPATLTLSGANSYDGTTTINAGTLVLSGSNSSYGATTLTAGTLQLGGSVNGGLAQGTLTFGNATAGAAVIQPLGADQTIANSTILNQNNGTISGSQNLQLSGSFMNSGGNRTLTSSLDPGKTLTLSGMVYLSEGNTARTLTIAGTGKTVVSSAMANGGTGACGVTKSGTGLLVLTTDNYYSGVTTISGGVLEVDSANALPGGLGTVTGASALTFNGGVLGLGAGDFSRSLATAGTVTGVNFTGNGGWAAYGADRLVNLGGASAQIAWATANTGFNAKTLLLGASNATAMVTLQNPLDLGTATRTVQVDDGAAAVDAALSGVLSGTGGLTKTGAGTLNLSGTNTYTGNTTVTAGSLLVSGSISSSAVIVAAGATLGGAGTISGSVTNSGAISPGASVGTLSTGSQVWKTNAAYRFELSSALNSAGMDLLNINGTLDVQATNFTLKLVSMANPTTPGLVPDFNGNSTYSWVIATASGGILNFDPGKFVIDASAFANPHSGTFSVAVQGNNLVVNYAVSAPLTPPTLSGFGPWSGGAFPLTFSGPNGQTYKVLSSTNVALPLTNWTVLSSGTFAGSSVTFTNSSATNKQQFYRIQSP